MDTKLEKKQRTYPFIMFLCCCLNTGIPVGLFYNCHSIFLTPVSEYFGCGRATFAMMTTIAGLTVGLSSSIWGKLVNTKSMHKMVAFMQLIMALTYMSMAKYTSVYMFWVAGAILGVTQGLLMLLTTPTIIRRWFSKRVGLFVGLASSMSGLCGMLINPIAGKILATQGWQTTFFIYGVLILCISFPVSLFVLKDSPESVGLKPYGYGESDDTEGADERNSGMIYDDAKKTTPYRILFLGALITTLAGGLMYVLPTYALTLGYSLEESALVATFVGFGILIGKNAMGTLMDINKYLGTAVGMLGPALGITILVTIGATSKTFLFIGAAFFGISVGIGPVLLPLQVMAVFGAKEQARILGAIMSVASILGAASSYIFGLLSDMANGFPIMLTGSAICYVLGFTFSTLALRARKNLNWE